MTEQTMLGWHFAEESRRLRYGDDRQIVIGETHEVKCAPVLCERGLHASMTVYDALSFAPGPILYRVRLSGDVVLGDDKACATRREYLAGFDATFMLRLFARKCALSVIHLWDAPTVVREYLETGDAAKRAAARDAAMAAAGATAWAAMAAAGAAAWDAAMAAAGAAMAAARAADRDAAMAADRDAAVGSQSVILENMAHDFITGRNR